MSKLLSSVIWRAVRGAVAVWLATQIASNVWYAPVIMALGKALREKFPGKVTDWIPI